MAEVRTVQAELKPQVEDLRQVAATLDPGTGPAAKRQAAFRKLERGFRLSAQAVRQSMSKVMAAFLPGLFVGGDDPDLPRDNLDLERFFRCPKGHERRIHGHRHAGVRIVHEGPTLIPALDAHLQHPDWYYEDELLPYAETPMPQSQQNSLYRRRIMRQARSAKKRPPLLQQLERRYSDSS